MPPTGSYWVTLLLDCVCSCWLVLAGTAGCLLLLDAAGPKCCDESRAGCCAMLLVAAGECCWQLVLAAADDVTYQ